MPNVDWEAGQGPSEAHGVLCRRCRWALAWQGQQQHRFGAAVAFKGYWSLL